MVQVLPYHLLWYQLYFTICYGTGCNLPFAMVPVVFYHLLWYQLYPRSLSLSSWGDWVWVTGRSDPTDTRLHVALSSLLLSCVVEITGVVYAWGLSVSDSGLHWLPSVVRQQAPTGRPGLYDRKSGSVRREVRVCTTGSQINKGSLPRLNDITHVTRDVTTLTVTAHDNSHLACKQTKCK